MAQVFFLEDLFEPFTDSEVRRLKSIMDEIDAEYKMTSTSRRVKLQDWPYNTQVESACSTDPEVVKLHKAIEQFPQRTKINLDAQPQNDVRITSTVAPCI